MPPPPENPGKPGNGVPDRKDRSRKVSVLTPGEWADPGGGGVSVAIGSPGGPIWPHARPLSAACAGLWTFMVI